MVEQWVKRLTEKVLGGAPFKIGDIVQHPSGRTVKILSGQYWGEFGLSNFWEWREVKGKKLGKLEHGYGWLNEHRKSSKSPRGRVSDRHSRKSRTANSRSRRRGRV